MMMVMMMISEVGGCFVIPSTSSKADVESDNSDQHTDEQHHNHRQSSCTPRKTFHFTQLSMPSLKCLNQCGRVIRIYQWTRDLPARR